MVIGRTGGLSLDVTGLTYNGTDQKGNIRWDGCANVKLRVYEGATKFGHLIASFNINTNNWVAQYASILIILNSHSLVKSVQCC